MMHAVVGFAFGMNLAHCTLFCCEHLGFLFFFKPVVIVTVERSTSNFTMKLLLPAFAVAVGGDAATPVQKVIEMMNGMLEKGKKEKHEE